MNFLDTYGITGTGTSTPPISERQPEQSLNDEVSVVIGQLGRFWGGFRKQSEAAFATARRDLGQVVTQAQREIEKLTTTESQQTVSEAEVESDAEESAVTPTANMTRAASTEPTHEDNVSGSSTSTTATTTQSFFARLQSSIPPNIVSTVQAQLPDSLRNAPQMDFAHLGSALSTEFRRVQGITRVQAEDYVHKSEALLREAVKEAGDVLRDAVKIIPPEESRGDAPIVWDGADIWMLPGLAAHGDGSAVVGAASKGKGKEVDVGPSSGRPSEDARLAVATRAESLLKQLKSNPEIIKVDPAVDTSRDAYQAWADASEASGQGFGTETWRKGVAEALADTADGAALQATFDALVPSCMPEEIFWVRYFFRVHQIEAEENRRKALLQSTAENEEDFSWEDDEEESSGHLASSQHTFAPPRVTSTSDVLSLPSSHVQSPRESSDESYDVVSGAVSSAGATEAEEHGEEDEDEDEDEEEEDEEGEDEDSDWE